MPKDLKSSSSAALANEEKVILDNVPSMDSVAQLASQFSVEDAKNPLQAFQSPNSSFSKLSRNLESKDLNYDDILSGVKRFAKEWDLTKLANDAASFSKEDAKAALDLSRKAFVPLSRARSSTAVRPQRY